MLLFAFTLIALSGYASGPSLGEVRDVVVVEISLGEDPQDKCEHFNPSPMQVQEFLNQSIIVGSLHDFRWSPCQAKGTAIVGTAHASWTMGAYGVGSVEVLSHGVTHNVASREAIRYARERMRAD